MRPVNEKALIPVQASGTIAGINLWISDIVQQLSRVFTEYGFRINRVYPKDGTEQAEVLTLNASGVSAPVATSGEAVIYISSAASIAGDELSYQSNDDKYTIGTFSSAGLWDDYTQDISTGKAVGANAPTWSSVNGTLQAYAFDDSTMNEMWLTSHIRHNIKQGTVIFPHIHWTPGNSTNTGVVVWGFEYGLSKGHGQQAFSTPTMITVNATSTGTPHMHYIHEVATADAIPATNIEPDTLIMFRICRLAADGDDNFVGDAFGLEFDLHYQMERSGSLNKEPTFYI